MNMQIKNVDVTNNPNCFQCGYRFTGRVRRVAVLITGDVFNAAMPICRFCVAEKPHPESIADLGDAYVAEGETDGGDNEEN